MLVIARKLSEGFTIGENVRVVVVRLQGHRVFLGIDAPKDVRIVRDEVALKQREEQR